MKILLAAVNSKFIHSNLAVRLLQTYTKDLADKAEIKVREFTINHNGENVLAEICLEQPDAVFISCYIWNWIFIQGLLKDLKKVLPESEVWLGGPEVSFDPERILEKHPEVTGILIGEGEATFRELAEQHLIAGEKDLSGIRGLCLGGPAPIRTGERSLLSMDEIPFIYQEDNIGEFDHKILYYETSRGCPFGCSYCLSGEEKGVRLRSLDQVYHELQFFLDHKVPQVKFTDRTFNVNREHTRGILNYIADHDNGVTNFHFEVAGDLLTDEEIGLLSRMRPGLVQLEIGVQSTNPETIKAIRRTMDLKRLQENVERIRLQGNIHQHLDLIAGLPFEGYERFAESFNDVYAMKPSQLQLGFLKVLKGSAIEKETDRWQLAYREDPPYEVLRTAWISYEEILKLKGVEEMVELYYNSGQFTRTLKVLEGEFSSPFAMYETLAEHVRQQGFSLSNPSRESRYQLLLDLMRKIRPERKELYEELLTLDLYLRENLKKRPAFSRDPAPFKELIRQFRPAKGQHAEIFFYPVWEEDPETVIRRREVPYLVLFDYEKRNPLDHNGSITIV